MSKHESKQNESKKTKSNIVPTKEAVPHPPAPDGHIPMKMSKPVAEAAPQVESPAAPVAPSTNTESNLSEQALPPQSREPTQAEVIPDAPGTPVTPKK